LLASCDAENQASAILGIQALPTREARKAEIRRQIAAVCPRPLSDDELEQVASFVEANRSKPAVHVVRMLSRMDAETRICRGMK
jgi:hypothetical protein